MTLGAPFPYFGGKSRAAHLIWERFGDPANFVEPFAGSLAVLLARPTEPRIETVNDLDCHIANFWRAVQSDPDAVAKWCDWPVNEADLHARHLWLVQGSQRTGNGCSLSLTTLTPRSRVGGFGGSASGSGGDGARNESRQFSSRTSAMQGGASTASSRTSAMRGWVACLMISKPDYAESACAVVIGRG